jgi:hypothetical protein
MTHISLAQICTAVSAQCPVQGSIYGYYPSLPANAFFLAFFALFALVNVGLGVRYRTWTFMIALTLGCTAEAVGYIGRVLLHSNPFNKTGFDIQIVCLIIAPAFVAAAIYLTLKHLTLCFGPEYSRIKPRYYTWTFVSFDILSLILQGAGGGLAATSSTKPRVQTDGNDLMLAGIVFQVATLLAFAAMVADYFLRLSRSTSPLPTEAENIKSKTSFQLFILGLILSFLAVFTRCVFRIAEMAGGWRNPIMQSEKDFIALDGCLVALAVLLLSIFHPGYCFPRLGSHNKVRAHADMEKKESVSFPETSP